MKEEIFIPSPLAQQLDEIADMMGITVDIAVENLLRNYLRSESNGR